MTLTAENLHSTVNKKQSTQTLYNTLNRFLQKDGTLFQKQSFSYTI